MVRGAAVSLSELDADSVDSARGASEEELSFFIAAVSLLRMRRDLPSERAVSGSRFAPKMTTMRATRTTSCHGPT